MRAALTASVPTTTCCGRSGYWPEILRTGPQHVVVGEAITRLAALATNTIDPPPPPPPRCIRDNPWRGPGEGRIEHAPVGPTPVGPAPVHAYERSLPRPRPRRPEPPRPEPTWWRYLRPDEQWVKDTAEGRR